MVEKAEDLYKGTRKLFRVPQTVRSPTAGGGCREGVVGAVVEKAEDLYKGTRKLFGMPQTDR